MSKKRKPARRCGGDRDQMSDIRDRKILIPDP
jgi:hypothetical protein